MSSANLSVPSTPHIPVDVSCRSGAAARIAGIPVATLRVWERRYSVVGPARAASGQRLYAPHDVERLVLVKQLVDLGHSIGTIAGSSLASLRALAAARVGRAGDGAAAALPAPTMALAIVGRSLARRLQSGAGQRAAAWAGASVTASYDDLAQALAALGDGAVPVQALWVQVPSLQPDVAERVLRLADGWPSPGHAPRVVVVYGFAPEPVLQRLRAAGIELHRDPLAPSELRALLASGGGAPPAPTPLRSPAPPHRFDDDALARFAAISSTVACECPRHVAELVMQLSAFEAYSTDCTDRSPADAQLHTYLADVAGSARALFEQALERIALAEGLALPPAAAAAGAA